MKIFRSCPHITPQPEKKGKIYWISGPPGAGKSTTCQLLGREKGFVYYEADAMLSFINPFIPLDADNPTMAQKAQKSLKVYIYSPVKMQYCTPQPYNFTGCLQRGL